MMLSHTANLIGSCLTERQFGAAQGMARRSAYLQRLITKHSVLLDIVPVHRARLVPSID
jgi:hypothetical protein